MSRRSVHTVHASARRTAEVAENGNGNRNGNHNGNHNGKFNDN